MKNKFFSIRTEKQKPNNMKIDQKDVPVPKFGKTALELLDSRNAEPPSVSSKYGTQFAMGFCGSLVQVVTNWTYRRPLIAGKIEFHMNFIHVIDFVFLNEVRFFVLRCLFISDLFRRRMGCGTIS